MNSLIKKIIELAGDKAVDRKHDYINTCHLFIAMNIVLKKVFTQDNPSKYISATKYDIPLLQEKYNKYIEVRREYNLIDAPFEEAFNKLMPRGNNNSGTCAQSVEFVHFRTSLEKISRIKNSITIYDFIQELFGPKDTYLFDLVSEASGSRERADEFYDKIRSIFYLKEINTFADLDKIPYMRNLNVWVSKNPRVVINADENINKIFLGLSGKSVSSVVLVGRAGCGKTELVYELAQRINSGNCPEEFKDKIIYSLDATGLVSGARYRGDTEGRLMQILEFVSKNKNIILFIDEIHQMVGLGNSSSDDESGGGSDILKPYLSRGDVRIIGATTTEEYTKYVMRSKAFARRLFKINIPEPSISETRTILLGIKPSLEKYFSKNTTEEVVDKVLEFANKYNLDQANPAKSVSILEMAIVYAKLFKPKNEETTIDDVLKAISLKYDVYVSKTRTKDAIEEMQKMILGQEEAINEMSKILKMIEANIVDEERPSGVVMLAGPTGVGKTYMAEIIAEKFYGSKSNLIKVNCSEYSEKHDVAKILGAPPGYVGYDDDTGLLSRIKQKPSSVVLFDELEKAHPDLFKIIMNLLDKGVIVDNRGDEISFKNSLILFTTNIGTDYNTGKESGLGFIKRVENVKDNVLEEMKNVFRPEFVGRIDRVITFNNLTNDVANKLIDRYLDQYNKKLENPIEFTQEDRDEIIKKSDIITEGARNIRKIVKDQMVKKLQNMEVLA